MVFLYKTTVNSYAHLVDDANALHSVAKSANLPESQRPRVCSASFIHYMLSMEALINRVMAEFIPAPELRRFILDRERTISTAEKWILSPLLITGATFDRGTYPFQHFAELIRVRNEYVHPKHDAVEYREITGKREWRPLTRGNRPPDFGISESDLIWPLTTLPKSSRALEPDHLDTVFKVTADTTKELDRLLGGLILTNDWYRKEVHEWVYPAGQNWDNLPREWDWFSS